MNTQRRTVTAILAVLTLGGSVLAAEKNAAGKKGTEDHPIYQESLKTLSDRAITELNKSAEGLEAWVQKMRPKDGARGRFRWSVDAKHPANFVSTAYILEGLDYIGIYDKVITAEDRKAGIAWIESTRQADGAFSDPVIPLGSRKGLWILARYKNRQSESAVKWLGRPWPTLAESEAKSLEWTKGQCRQLNPWGWGSRVTRHMRRLLVWYQQGKISIDPMVDSLKYVYSLQDPETGLCDRKNSVQDRINGTMKMFGFTQNMIELPIPHAKKIIDTVLDQRMLTPEYDRLGIGGCHELDNWMVLSETVRQTGDYRIEEIRKLAAHRIVFILRNHLQSDGGLSASANRCQTHWNSIEMAPAIAQGDALALATLTRSISVCVRLLDMADRTNWTGHRGWDESERPVSKELQHKLASLVFGEK